MLSYVRLFKLIVNVFYIIVNIDIVMCFCIIALFITLGKFTYQTKNDYLFR